MTTENKFVALTKCYVCMEASDIIIHQRMQDISKLDGAVVTTEPCQKCKEIMETSIICISVRDGESGENPYRTGGWWAIRPEAIQRVFKPGPDLDAILTRRMTFVPDTVCKMVGLQVPTQPKEAK